MAREDWRTRYQVLRGPSSTTPMLHRWRIGPPYAQLLTACGLGETVPTYNLVLVRGVNVSPDVPRCRRCWR